MSGEPKPCAHCGSTILGWCRPDGDVAVECRECGVRGPVEDSDHDAIASWNRRTTPSQGLDAATVERCALQWLAEHPRCAVEYFGPVYGDDDDQSTGWRVMRESGPINDREWDEIGRGNTPLAAIQAAALATDPHQHGGKGA